MGNRGISRETVNVFAQHYEQIMAKQTKTIFTVAIQHRGPFRNFEDLIAALHNFRLAPENKDCLVIGFGAELVNTKTETIKYQDCDTEVIRGALLEAAKRAGFIKVGRPTTENEFRLVGYAKRKRCDLEFHKVLLSITPMDGRIKIRIRPSFPKHHYTKWLNPNDPDFIDHLKDLLVQVHDENQKINTNSTVP